MMMMLLRGNARNNNNNNNNRSNGIRYPFTASQWEELEQQVLVFKYMVSGIPIPADLLFTIHSSLSSQLLFGFEVGLGRKVDMEPGRCRRTDGKKWRCSKDAHPDSKYCQRHMHRGRNPCATNPPPETHRLHPHSNSNIQPATGRNKTTRSPSHSFLFTHPSPTPQTTHCSFLNPDCRQGPVSGSQNCYRLLPLDSLDGQEKEQEKKKKKKKVTMHHFLDEWSSPKAEDATNWPNNGDDQSTPKLLHDFFMTKK